MRTAAEADRVSRRLVELHRHATRYEVAVTFPATGERFLLGYRRPPNRGELLRLVLDDEPLRLEVVRRSGLEEEDPAPTYDRASGWRFGEKLAVGRTGRTERQALLEGELPRLVPA